MRKKNGKNDAAALYEKAGVCLKRGEKIVEVITALVAQHSGVKEDFRGFGGLYELKGFANPLLVSSTDGIGTKALWCAQYQKDTEAGIDLVAMCVNDILAMGAKPLFFLDYFATHTLQVEQAKRLINGVLEGCREAGCVLLGGETAEMPSLSRESYELVGFAVGAMEKGEQLPFGIKEGDHLIGLPSSGLHANGFSLVRKIFEEHNIGLGDPWQEKGLSLYECVLAPTKIYVKELLPLISKRLIKGLIHVTGGGFQGNIPRVLPPHLGVEILLNAWERPPLFQWLGRLGHLSVEELCRVFNAGIGMIAVVDQKKTPQILMTLKQSVLLGRVVQQKSSSPRVQFLSCTKLPF